MTVSIDFETRSVIDLPQAGGHRYAEHPSTRVLCMSWSVGVGSTQLWWAGQPFPQRLGEAILDGTDIQAWNAAFERVIWPIMVRRHGAPEVKLEQWRCTMVRALLMGYPGKLENAGPTLGLGVCKDAAGHRVMLQVSKPRKVHRPGDGTYEDALTYAALAGGAALPEYEIFFEDDVRCVAQWWVDEERLSKLGAYCVTDTDVERAAADVLDPMPERELRGWQLDQRINDRGFQVDMELVEAARKMVKPATLVANKRLVTLTNGELKSVTKPNEIRSWLSGRLGIELDSIKKDVLTILLAEMPMDEATRAVIKLRLAAAKTSVAKLNSLVRGTQVDGRLRGGLQYAGAGRTNRWCLAEGTEVLCKHKLTGKVLWITIEKVTTEYSVHDGENWVEHDGSVLSGDKDVISHAGVIATPTHIVWTNPDTKMTLAEAKQRDLPLWNPPTPYTQ